MTKTIASALCFLALIGLAHCKHPFIEGKVYCDSCNVEFLTGLAKFVEGATVRMECTCPQTGKVTYSAEGKTGQDGGYRMPVGGDPVNDRCEVKAVWSPDPECNIPTQSAAQTISTHIGEDTEELHSHSNHLRFIRKQPLGGCADMFKVLYH